MTIYRPDDAEPAGWLEDPAAQWRLAINVWYEGPFERAGYWLLAIDRTTNEIWREVPDGSLQNWLANRAEALDRAWRGWYVRRRRWPPDRWVRKVPA